MAPLPENNTARLWVDYTDGINQHSIMFRTTESAGLTALMTIADDFLDALSPTLYLLTILAARVSAPASSISTPVGWTGAGTYGSGAMPAVRTPLQMCFLGRSTLGRRVRWFVFGTKVDPTATYRLNTADNADVQAARTVLVNGVNAGTLVAIDGDAPVIYAYVDQNYNSYWEAEARS